MISRSSSGTRSLPSQSAFPPCFPSASAGGATGELRTLPERPRWKEPILDPDSCSVPISEFDDQAHSCFYGLGPDGAGANVPTAQPEGFTDEYLLPSLTRNERLRLTMLWYHTNGLLEDRDFQARLQSIVGLVQTFFQGWEFAIMGFVFEDAFTRIATAGMPLAIVPRRESPCSHTVTQVEQGKVFFLPDMLNDWRFKASPTAKQGLRGYAGAQLRCDTPGGESVALGSLCIASNRKQPALSSAQQDALIRFADMLSAEIVGHSREARKQQRQVMARLLAECRLNDLEDAEKRILDVVKQVYGEACVKFVEPSGEQIPLPAHAPIELCEINDGLWEDTEAIEELIRNSNHKTLRTLHTVRAIIHQVQTYPVVRYLVVASTQVQLVYDDVDAWFIQACAMSLGKIIQERIFGEALMVKERFLRGITHQLRTPIHGVLGSCELLTEELSNRRLSGVEPQTCEPGGTNIFTILDTIRDSGMELMTTVNNMLKLNRWAETTIQRKPTCLEDWTRFEDDILSDVEQAVHDHEQANISIFFHNNLPEDETEILVDIALLKECIQSLVLNALHATKQGSIIITTNAAPDRSYLEVDVTDTGCGIAPADKERIFEAYEKVDVHSRGAGLGLTLATNIAKLMHGNVTLLKSSQDVEDQGSHFRVTVATSSPVIPIPITNGLLPQVPGGSQPGPTFYRVTHQQQDCVLTLNFAQYLERHGFQQNETSEGSITLLPFVADPDAFAALLRNNSHNMCVCLMPTGAKVPTECQGEKLRTFSGPFTSLRLKQILADIQQTWKALHHIAPAPETDGTLERPTMNGSNNGLQLSHTSSLLDPSHTPAPPVDIAPHALLVDDNLINLRIMRMYCEKRAISHVTATNGREAVDAFKASLQPGQRPLNLVLMDLQMPVCDGADATREIRELEQQQAGGGDGGTSGAEAVAGGRSCIFMVTGQDSLADKARSFAAGADEFYVKPLGMKKLDAGIGLYFTGFGKALGVSRR